ncbi:MAG: hypothetical protein Q9170_005759 [Blastenia crenularia]
MAEAAGLVLAAFTVVVQGLSSFVQSMEMVKSWRFYRRELKIYARDLECQRIWYLDTLEELFDGIIHSEDEMAELLQEPSGPKWKRHEKGLQERLGTAYPSYQQCIVTLTEALKAFPEKVGLNDSGEVRPGTARFKQRLNRVSNAAPAPIADLCSAIQPRGPAAAVRVLEDEDLNCRHDINVLGPVTCPIESLDGLLCLSGSHLSALYLSRLSRLRVAVTLASSVIQLDQTSWLRSQWNSADILFMSQDAELGQPFLSSTPTSPVEAAEEFAHLIHNDTLFALGVTLIELAFGKPLADMRRPQDDQSDRTLTTIKTTHRLLDSVYKEIGGRYSDVVRRCIHGSFDVRDKTMENEEFQEVVYDMVLIPLMQDLQAFDGSVAVPSEAFAS